MSTAVVPIAAQRSTVQVTGGRGADVVRRPWESVTVFGLFSAAYIAFGEWLVVHLHVVGFDTLDRFTRALMVWHNNPGKLSALGFDIPPLDTLVLLPLTIVPDWVRSLALVPLASALAAGWVMVALNLTLRRALVPPGLRAGVLLALGANPLVALYASDGARDFLGLALITAAAAAVFAWYLTADVRFVLVAGLIFAVAALAAYGSLLWFLGCTLIVARVLRSHRASGDEVEGTTIGLAAPVVYTVTLWVVFNLVLTHHPFGWIPVQHDAAHYGVGALIRGTLQIILYGAPIAIVVLPALVVIGLRRGDSFALWLAALLAIACLDPFVEAALRLTDSPLAMRGALPILVFSVIGAAWIARSAGVMAAALLIVALFVSIPWTFEAMQRVRHQNLEAVFAEALKTGHPQDGTLTPSGTVVGVSQERQMADWIDAHVHGDGAILTDNAQTYAVMLLTGQPQLFFDRVDRSDGPWLAAARDPAGQASYMLLSRKNPRDLLSAAQPQAAAGTDARFPVAYADQRYVLVRVPGATSTTATNSETDHPPTDQGERP